MSVKIVKEDELDFELLSQEYKDGYLIGRRDAIREFADRIKSMRQTMYLQRYVDLRDIEDIENDMLYKKIEDINVD